MPATAAHLLTRERPREGEAPPFLGDLRLATSRVHELCGPARRSLALMIAAAMEGPIFWISPAWNVDRLNPDGFSHLVNPGRITFVEPERAPDLLWCCEEVLRTGAVPLMVGDLPAPPALTPVRRLHLAAETGAARGIAPLGLILTPGDGGAAGVESRWSLAPALPGDGAAHWTLTRMRARALPPKHWDVSRKKELSPRVAVA
ncbi:MAG: hypothetical protein AAF092_00020 [Pseudomonadota bacterium]